MSRVGVLSRLHNAVGNLATYIWLRQSFVAISFERCRYFLAHVACRNLPWQGLFESNRERPLHIINKAIAWSACGSIESVLTNSLQKLLFYREATCLFPQGRTYENLKKMINLFILWSGRDPRLHNSFSEMKDHLFAAL